MQFCNLNIICYKIDEKYLKFAYHTKLLANLCQNLNIMNVYCTDTEAVWWLKFNFTAYVMKSLWLIVKHCQ